jgi:hypothetical protein
MPAYGHNHEIIIGRSAIFVNMIYSWQVSWSGNAPKVNRCNGCGSRAGQRKICIGSSEKGFL